MSNVLTVLSLLSIHCLKSHRNRKHWALLHNKRQEQAHITMMGWSIWDWRWQDNLRQQTQDLDSRRSEWSPLDSSTAGWAWLARYTSFLPGMGQDTSFWHMFPPPAAHAKRSGQQHKSPARMLFHTPSHNLCRCCWQNKTSAGKIDQKCFKCFGVVFFSYCVWQCVDLKFNLGWVLSVPPSSSSGEKNWMSSASDAAIEHVRAIYMLQVCK